MSNYVKIESVNSNDEYYIEYVEWVDVDLSSEKLPKYFDISSHEC